MFSDIHYLQALNRNLYPSTDEKRLHFKGIDAAQSYLMKKKKNVYAA